MLETPLLLIHISTAVVGLISGFLSLLFRKGTSPHRIAGTIFFVSMLCMSGAGAFLAAFVKPNPGNVMGGLLTFYLVATAWIAGRRRQPKVGPFDFGGLLMILMIAAMDVTFGVQAAISPTGMKAGYPPALYFIFGSIALLFAVSDLRMIARGGVAGAQRLGRHLWRMCFALFIATISFYPARARLFSKAINDSNVLYLPHVVLAVVTMYWLIRISRRKRARRNDLVPSEPAGVEV